MIVVITLIRANPTITLSIEMNIAWLSHLNRLAIIEFPFTTVFVIALINTIVDTGFRCLTANGQQEGLRIKRRGRSSHLHVITLVLGNRRRCHTFLRSNGTNNTILSERNHIGVPQRASSRITTVIRIVDGSSWSQRLDGKLVIVEGERRLLARNKIASHDMVSKFLPELFVLISLNSCLRNKERSLLLNSVESISIGGIITIRITLDSSRRSSLAID